MYTHINANEHLGNKRCVRKKEANCNISRSLPRLLRGLLNEISFSWLETRCTIAARPCRASTSAFSRLLRQFRPLPRNVPPRNYRAKKSLNTAGFTARVHAVVHLAQRYSPEGMAFIGTLWCVHESCARMHRANSYIHHSIAGAPRFAQCAERKKLSACRAPFASPTRAHCAWLIERAPIANYFHIWYVSKCFTRARKWWFTSIDTSVRYYLRMKWIEDQHRSRRSQNIRCKLAARCVFAAPLII